MAWLVHDKRFYREALRIAIPIALQSLITVGVNMLDTIMLGQLEESALSASALANQVFTLFQIMCMGLGMGASVLTSRFYGSGDTLSLKKAVSMMYRLTLGFSITFTLVCGLAPGFVMRIYTPEAELIAQGIHYFRWALPCFAMHAFGLTTAVILRSVGKTHIPLISSIITFFINVFFNWMLIFGHLGAPRMGIAGAALATTISRCFELLVNCGYFFFWEKKICFRFSDLLLPCRDIVGIYLKISIPVLISDTLLGLGNSMISVVMGHIGGSFVSANSITSVTQQLCTVVIQGVSNAASIMTGHTLGEGDRERARLQGNTFLLLGAAIGLLGSGLILMIAPLVVGPYKVSAETKDMALELMRAISFIMAFQCMNSVMTKGVLRGGGDTKFLMVADVIFLWLVSVPLGACAGLLWHWTPFFIYICLKLDQVLKAILCVFRLRSEKWIKQVNVQ